MIYDLKTSVGKGEEVKRASHFMNDLRQLSELLGYFFLSKHISEPVCINENAVDLF